MYNLYRSIFVFAQPGAEETAKDRWYIIETLGQPDEPSLL